MKKIIVFVLPIFFSGIALTAQRVQQTGTAVFTSGSEGHKSYRIPAIVKLPGNDLLAFCEGRVDGSGDFGDINIVMKRSSDKGKNWSSLTTVVDAADLQAGNPAPVVDVTDPGYPNGKLFLFYNTGNNHEGEVRKGNGLREVWYISSIDGGINWSSAVNITTQVHRPMQPAANSAYRFKEDWRSYANTPGHALQIQEGKYRGRIYVAANHSEGNPKPNAEDYFAHGFYTDDHGETFHLSETIQLPGGNEATAAETSNGGLLLNARNQQGGVKARIVARSNDGGQAWYSIAFDKNLPDPVCEGSILNIGSKKGRKQLVFCNAADTLQRNKLTLRVSDDEGVSWKKSFLIDSTENKHIDYTAYSDLVVVDKNRIGVLYERDNYKTIRFVVVSIQGK